MSTHLADHIDHLLLVLAPEQAKDHDEIERLRRRISSHAEETPTCWLYERLGLEESEVRVLWVLAAIAASPQVRQLVHNLGPTQSADPTLETLRRIVYGDDLTLQVLRQLGEEGSLRALRIIERSDGGPSSLAEHRQTWTLSRRMLSLLLGDDIQLDPELRELATIEDRVPNADSLAYSEGLVSRCRTAVETRHGVVSVYGLPGLGRRTLLHAVAAENDLRIIDIRSDRLASMPIEQARPQLRALARECKVLGRVPLLSCIDALPSEMIALVGEELVSRLLGPVFVTCDTARRPPLRWSRPTISIEASRPSTRRLGELWQQSFDHGCELTGNELAVAFPLAPSLIVQAAETAKATGTVSLSKLRDGIRSVVRPAIWSGASPGGQSNVERFGAVAGSVESSR